jgi:hypothetical protein
MWGASQPYSSSDLTGDRILSKKVGCTLTGTVQIASDCDSREKEIQSDLRYASLSLYLWSFEVSLLIRGDHQYATRSIFRFRRPLLCLLVATTPILANELPASASSTRFISFAYPIGIAMNGSSVWVLNEGINGSTGGVTEFNGSSGEPMRHVALPREGYDVAAVEDDSAYVSWHRIVIPQRHVAPDERTVLPSF